MSSLTLRERPRERDATVRARTHMKEPGRSALLAALLLGLVPAGRVRADAPLTLSVEPAVPADVAALRAGLARDLEREVQLGEDGDAHLSVTMREGQAVLRYRDADAERVRRVALPADRSGATSTLLLIGAELVRDPTDELVGPPATPPGPSPEGSSGAVPESSDRARSDAAPGPSQRANSDAAPEPHARPDPSPGPSQQPSSEATPGPHARPIAPKAMPRQAGSTTAPQPPDPASPGAAPEASRPTEPAAQQLDSPETTSPTIVVPAPRRPEPNLAVAHPFQFGVGVLGGAASTAHGVRGLWALGMNVMGTVHPNISIGVTNLSIDWGYSSGSGFLFGVQATPVFELFGFVDPRIQVYGQIGVALQVRSYTGRPFQVAPFLGGGTRFWVLDWFSIGVEIGLHLIATNDFLMNTTSSAVALAQGSVTGSLGLNADWHF